MPLRRTFAGSVSCATATAGSSCIVRGESWVTAYWGGGGNRGNCPEATGAAGVNRGGRRACRRAARKLPDWWNVWNVWNVWNGSDGLGQPMNSDTENSLPQV